MRNKMKWNEINQNQKPKPKTKMMMRTRMRTEMRMRTKMKMNTIINKITLIKSSDPSTTRHWSEKTWCSSHHMSNGWWWWCRCRDTSASEQLWTRVSVHMSVSVMCQVEHEMWTVAYEGESTCECECDVLGQAHEPMFNVWQHEYGRQVLKEQDEWCSLLLHGPVSHQTRWANSCKWGWDESVSTMSWVKHMSPCSM
jgi:hypothetical protein